MSRCGYLDDEEFAGQFALWRANLRRAINGRRGQSFLRRLRDALDALSDRQLGWGGVENRCAIGAILSPQAQPDEDYIAADDEAFDDLARQLAVGQCLLREVAHQNDHEAPNDMAARWHHMREWVEEQIREALPS